MQVEQREQRRYALLLVPVGLFLLLFFVVPIAEILFRSVYSDGFTLANYKELFANTVYIRVIGLTFKMVTVVTLICLFLGYPVALVIAGLRERVARIVRVFVLVPLLTSVIVRTYAWMVLLGTHGIVNDALMALGITSEPVKLLYTFASVVIGMIYVMLPFAILTLESVMRNIDPSLMRASHNLGASRLQAFWRVFLPLSLPGVVGGMLLVFIMSLGYYITPALLGGPRDVVIAMLIARQVEFSMNWAFASSLAVMLLVITLAGFFLLNRLIGLQHVFETRA